MDNKIFFDKFSISLPFLCLLVGYQLRRCEVLLTVISKKTKTKLYKTNHKNKKTQFYGGI